MGYWVTMGYWVIDVYYVKLKFDYLLNESNERWFGKECRF